MGLGYGLISCQLAPGDPRGWADLYREALELAALADRLGIDSVWTTEHHFVDDGYMPSLLVTSAAIAARTERIRIGTGVVLAPLHDPIRLAEDAATVSLLSQGRFVLGLGLGWSAAEFGAFGTDLRERGARMEEILSILPRAWNGEPVDWHGLHYEIPAVAVRPVPESRPPIWIGGGADAAVRRAARLADGFFSNAVPSRFARQVRVAAAEQERVGREGSFDWAYYQICHVADDPEQGWREVRDAIRLTTWKYVDMEASAVRIGPVPEPPPMSTEEESALRNRVLVGPAEMIAERVIAIREQVGVAFELVARSYFPGMPFAAQQEQVHRLAEELAPLLRV